MNAIDRFQGVVDQTLSALFPRDRNARGVILARITKSDVGGIECDLRAPEQYVTEIVTALQCRLVGWDYILNVRPL